MQPVSVILPVIFNGTDFRTRIDHFSFLVVNSLFILHKFDYCVSSGVCGIHVDDNFSMNNYVKHVQWFINLLSARQSFKDHGTFSFLALMFSAHWLPYLSHIKKISLVCYVAPMCTTKPFY